MMKRFSIPFLIVAIALTSCATTQSQKTLSQAKAGLDCIECKDAILWKSVSDSFGTPDIALPPEPGTNLSQNARMYRGKTIIFYTERREVREGERTRFQEVVTKVEICKDK